MPLRKDTIAPYRMPLELTTTSDKFNNFIIFNKISDPPKIMSSLRKSPTKLSQKALLRMQIFYLKDFVLSC